ncbi:MAG TPA: 2-oxoglutarate and iron-dependent oxygenase domain-containing protein [Vitreimonas sp.]|uniref:isopenicillin N synthase family dioxygenase n=1 Tax=Vitreimonas sp. TaxID=3069702 RepID=UPI002D7617A9|nr:2-oxoglutarate and iron-dependent oxygenase domain-containing protein [Vitreimonas sp.]HYD89343.1 2-oxoglutarate and iron-dependent oxygenase domain-containing protein [Vitreimonas sp.]
MVLDALPALSMRERRADPHGFARAMGESYTRFGFAIVRDHGLDSATIARALDSTKTFFALPDEVKRRYHVAGGAGQRGYVPFGVEAAKGAAKVDLKEFWHVGRELPEGHRYRAFMPHNVWPSEIASFREDVYALYAALDALGGELLQSIALFLQLKPDFFVSATRDGNSVLRLLHYPPTPPNPEGVRAEAHEDINVITLLLGAEEAGLQLLTREGKWLDVNPPEGALVVNVGDMLQRLTNHQLPSTSHRVVNPAPERAHLPRFSIPFFLHFAPDYLIETLPGCVTPDNPNRYRQPITAQDFLFERLREIRLA